MMNSQQTSLFGASGRRKITNVASVPQRSPFRYPGGKTWLIPRVRCWLKRYNANELFEPFAGGGIVTLTAVMEGYVNHGTLVELDRGVAAVWKTILSDENEWLAERIQKFDLTLRNVREELDRPAESTREQAFQTILKNRCYRGGILADGAGLMKEGEGGKGLGSRWYPATLKKRIQAIAHYRSHISVIEGDGFQVMEQYANHTSAAWFIDPPYTKAAKRLYRHYAIDHSQLFDLAENLSGDFLMTYDHTEEIIELAAGHSFATQLVAMKNTHHAEQTELLIGRNLNWLTD